jgi:putative tryptophan/tyrosine transport system substrate-binding protein
MRRREFVMLAGTAVVSPLVARAEQRSSLPRIGYLSLRTAANPHFEGEFLAGLRDLGHIDGKSIEIEFRFTGGDPKRLAEAAGDFVSENVDIIVTYASGITAARGATSTIPIVMATGSDVVAMGYAASLAHPGGNVTGSNFFLPELMAKRLQLLKEVLPSMSRAGVLFLRGAAATPKILEVMDAAAKALSLDLSPIEVSGPEAFESAFSSWAEQKVNAVVVLDIFTTLGPAIADLAAKHRFASIGRLELATAGGLIGYGVDFPPMYRRAAVFVDKILKGAKPGEIPIELATKFQTIVNLRTAKALGLEIPTTVLAGAEEVIE